MAMKDKVTAVVLAGGRGRRMESNIQKQYMILNGKPLLYYALKVFQDNDAIDSIVLVTGAGEIEYCQEQIVDLYHFYKVDAVVEGGEARYDSVYAGLKAAVDCSYVLIHDGARPFVDHDMIARALDAAKEYDACVLGMPVKDTIRLSDDKGFSAATPARKNIWTIQTPQAFSYSLILEAYEKMFRLKLTDAVTDDGMVVEISLGRTIKLVEGSYQNIKITTPEDMLIAEAFARKMS